MIGKHNYEKKHNDVSSICLYGDKKDKVDVSIIIPAFKRYNLLKEAVLSAINQNYDGEYEVIIVDNTDDESYIDFIKWLKNLNKDFIVYYRNEKNIGMFGNWNRGLELASGDWLVILCSDDLLEKNYLNVMMKCVRNLPNNTSIIGCNHLEMVKDVIPIEKNNLKMKIYNSIVKSKAISVCPRDMYFGSFFSLVGALINKEYALNIGGFNEDYYPSSDHVFILNSLFAGYRLFQIQENLAIYRIEENESMNIKTIEMFIRYQNETKEVIIHKKQYLPPAFAEYFRQVSVAMFEELLFEKWINVEDYKQFITDINRELNILMPSKIEKVCYRFYMRIKYIYYILFRKYIRIK